MRLRLRVVLVGAVLCAISACSNGTSLPAKAAPAGEAATPKSSVELHRLALSPTTAPAGITISDHGPVDDRHDYDGIRADHSKPECNVLLGMSAFIFGGTAILPVGNTSVTLFAEHNPVEPWIATERLDSYRSGGAHQVMQDLRTLVGKCPTIRGDTGNFTFAIKPGPDLGDESLTVAATSPPAGNRGIDDSNATVVRSGDELIIIEEYGTPANAPTPMATVAAAAYHVLAFG